MKSSFLLILLLGVSCLFYSKPSLTHPSIDLYNQAVGLVNLDKLANARDTFQKVQLIYPLSSPAMKAQLMLSFVNYLSRDYVTSLLDCEKYIKIYPNSNDADYIYYLRAMSYYKQIGVFHRDSTMASYALEAFTEVMKKFPGNKYASNAKIKHDEILNYLAAKEIEIGTFYLYRGNYTPAIRRFKNLIQNYQDSYYVPEARRRLLEIFNILGLPKEKEYYS